MTRRIAIIGNGASKVSAPIDDPSWEVWGMAWLLPARVDRAYEPHHVCYWGESMVGAGYVPRLASLTCELVLRDPHPELPRAMLYPRKEIVDWIGFDYHSSTFSYMILHALYEREVLGRPLDEIGAFGIDMLRDEEYTWQRPNAEFLLGIAHAMGVTLTIAAGSTLLKCPRKYGDPP